MRSIFVRSYTEEGHQPIPCAHLSEEAYAVGLQRFVPGCQDIVPIDSRRRKMYLARRRSKPMKGLWWIGGGMYAHQTKEEAAVALFRQETGIELSAERFKLVAIFDYRWKDREQTPQDIGCHMIGYTNVVELSDEEICAIEGQLDRQEYEEGYGLRAYAREDLVLLGVFPAVLDLYDHIFPPTECVERGTLELVASDVRRDILEHLFTKDSIQDFFVKDGSRPLGNHFHRHKFEIFYFLQGGGTVQTAEVSSSGTIIGPISQADVVPGSVVKIPAFRTHRFDLLPNTRFIAYSSQPFDANDMTVAPLPPPQ